MINCGTIYHRKKLTTGVSGHVCQRLRGQTLALFSGNFPMNLRKTCWFCQDWGILTPSDDAPPATGYFESILYIHDAPTPCGYNDKMAKDNQSYLQQKIDALEKECAYLRSRCARLSAQQTRRKKINNINKNLLQKTNEKLLQCHKLSQQENLSKSDFLANMSHEIRTPLNIILGMANLLAETELDRTQMQYLSSLRITGGQLMEILNNILEFSRIDAGKITIEPEPFSLQKIIYQIEASALPLCLQKKLNFHRRTRPSAYHGTDR